MANEDYKFLYRSYRFLEAAIETHGHGMTGPDRDALRQERATTFRKLLTEQSGNPQITLLQIKSLIECLRTPSQERDVSALIADICQSHLRRLGEVLDHHGDPSALARVAAPVGGNASHLDPEHLSILEVSSDRMCILDTDYRYRYVNTAQAKFHRVSPSEFIGKSNSDVVSENFFARVMKPIFDKCFGGEPVDLTTYHPERAPDVIYQCRFDPIRDGEGRAVALLASCRGLPASDVLKAAAIVCPGLPIGAAA